MCRVLWTALGDKVMKKFIMRHWRRIIYFFAGFAILVNLILVWTTPKTIIDDFYKYGPDYKYDIIDRAGDVNIDAESRTDSMAQDLSYNSGLSDNASKAVVIVAILICFLLIFQNVIDGNTASAEKK